MRIYIVTIIILLVDYLGVKLWLVSPAEYLEGLYDNTLQAVGYIEPISIKETDTSINFILDCENIVVQGKQIVYKDKLRVYIHKGKKDMTKGQNVVNEYPAKKLLPIAAGKVKAIGKLEKLRGFANPGTFDMESYNWVQGYGGMLREAQVISLSQNTIKLLGKNLGEDIRFLDYFSLCNVYLRNKVEGFIVDRNNANSSRKVDNTAALLTGMVLGGSNGLNDETRESFSNNGLSHLLSVSGTHLMLLAGFLQAIFKRIKILGASQSKWLLLVLLIGYACLCGLRPPVVRALGMSAILLWGRTDNINQKPLTVTDSHKTTVEKSKLLCVLCMLLLMYKPIWILDLGFQLSFGAAFGIALIMPKLKRWLNGLGFLGEGIAVTIAAQLATMPIMFANFYSFPMFSVISNIFLVPVLELAHILTILGMLCSCAWDCLGNIFVQMAAFLVEQILVQAELIQSLPFSLLVIGALPLYNYYLFYLILFSFFDVGGFKLLSNGERKFLICSCLTIIFVSYSWQQYRSIPTTIYFADVGQGDAAVIMSPEHKIAVIDTGGLKSIDTGSRIITPIIRSLGRNNIELLIASHCDFDHIGGGGGLARNINVSKLILPNEKYTEDGTVLMNNILKKIKKENWTIAREGKVFDLGGTIIKLVSVPETEVIGNDASTVVEVLDIKSGKKVLFTGDMTIKREASLKSLGNYDVLKVGHHGSKGSTSDLFLERIKPQLAIISCGYRNMYGHPHRATLERLENAGCKVLRTDESGCVQVELTEEGIKVKSW